MIHLLEVNTTRVWQLQALFLSRRAAGLEIRDVMTEIIENEMLIFWIEFLLNTINIATYENI